MHPLFNALDPKRVRHVNGKHSLLVGLCVGNTLIVELETHKRGDLLLDFGRVRELNFIYWVAVLHLKGLHFVLIVDEF